MLTVLLETRNNEARLAQTLAALVPGAVEGLVSDVLVLDRGSTDASRAVADAAGARFMEQGALSEALRLARGTWLLLLEPGARPLRNWVNEVAEHMAVGRTPARFSASQRHRRSFLHRLVRPQPPLERGFLMRRSDAAALVHPGMALSELVRRRGVHRLPSELMPAWAAGPDGQQAESR
ncbi:glycosyltransferase [Rhizobium sp. YIM 134829]|uniref:glycosyltransferase n=1 Tax=Rhizobium sp. YIM 134829 TaxID=3390453 RepID=UPI003979909E